MEMEKEKVGESRPKGYEMKEYDFSKVEEYWRQEQEKSDIFKTADYRQNNSYYVLEMFPYPSGRLHMGHLRNYTLGDVYARYLWMNGYEVLHPMGWDSFGLPAENAAIKHGIHPKKWTEENIAYMKKQMKMIGFSYDWDREVATHTPEYYRWCQWLFIQMFKKGLAYQKESYVNWCPNCQTVLANEQVIGGKCWRCDAEVEKKKLKQWYLKITEYAPRLLKDLEKLSGWPEKVKIMQKNWIGESEGVRLEFYLEELDEKIETFTTRVDTLYGVTYVVVAPEHPIVERIVELHKENGRNELADKIEEFVRKVLVQPEYERTAEEKEKEGIYTGFDVMHPLTGKKVPLWIGNYVVFEYGTGAVMAVPAHDQRDFLFAKKYNLPLVEVIKPRDREWDFSQGAYEERGVMLNSEEFDGMDSEEAKVAIAKKLESIGKGARIKTYKLRDWLISRQRYWGAPIPIIHCPKCGAVPVPEDQLPVLLPDEFKYEKGKSPLEVSEEFVKVKCPVCGADAKRDTDTMDTFVDSSWYYWRYVDPKNSQKIFDEDKVKSWKSVDWYIGGVEHAVLHLLYARFINKFLYDEGLVGSDEPFSVLFTQGMVLKDGAKMSKSKGNVVDPEEIVSKYGADTARVFMMFAAPPERDLEWSDDGVAGAHRFLKRVWRLAYSDFDTLKKFMDTVKNVNIAGYNWKDKEFGVKVNRVVKAVTEDVRNFELNTGVSQLMILTNELEDKVGSAGWDEDAAVAFIALIKMLHPYAPFITQQIWVDFGNNDWLVRSKWPTYNEEMLEFDTVEVIVQVNGKLRGKIKIEKDASKDAVLEKARNLDNVKRYLEGKKIIKEIVVPNKLVNFVVR